MNKEMATIIAALVGSVIGSLGAAYLRYRLDKSKASDRRQDRVLQRYLSQLQDALESFWLRLYNLSRRDGRSTMSQEYFRLTTIYAWTRVVSYSRILLLDGIYAQLSDKLTITLKNGFDQIDRKLKDHEFQYYDRIALAEALILKDGIRLRPSTYLEFRNRSKDPLIESLFDAAGRTLENLDNMSLDQIRADISEMLRRVSEKTKMPVSERLKEYGY